MEKPILVIGAGSIGERHIQQLLRLGHKDIYVLRSRGLPLRTIPEEACRVITTWKEVDDIGPFAAIICSPTALHFEQLEACTKRGIHALVEKPVSHLLQSPESLAQLFEGSNQPVHVQVAYMLRYHPFVREVRDIMERQALGKLLHMQSYWGEYLPNWHPWEDYRESYAARKSLGGGVALTLSHDIDLACYLMNETPEYSKSSFQHLSPLEVDVDSAFDLTLRSSGGIQANIHLNFFEKKAHRTYRLVFEEGSVVYDYFQQEMTVFEGGQKRLIPFHSFQRDDMFLAQTQDFLLQCTRANNQQSLANLIWANKVVGYCSEA